MTKYVKLIDKYTIIQAPQNKNNILNYNINKQMTAQDNYLELTEQNIPDNTKRYRSCYASSEGKIVQSWEEIKPSYSALRELEYPALGDMIDAFCKAHLGSDEELRFLQTKRQNIKQKYPKE